MPVADAVIEDEVHRHLESEGRLEDDEHRAEVTESSTKAFKTQIVLDAIAEAEKVQVSQDELTQYLVQGAAQYGMDPNEFVQVLSQNGQIPAMVGEVARNKALAIALGKAKVTDAAGNAGRPLRVHRRGRGRRGRRRGTVDATPPRRPPRRRSRLASAPPRRPTPRPRGARRGRGRGRAPKKPARKRAAKKADAE